MALRFRLPVFLYQLNSLSSSSPFCSNLVLCRHGHAKGFADQTERSARMMKRLLGEFKKTQRNVLHPTGIVVAQTGPKFLTDQRGHEKSISRRQVVLNKHFIECITDVLLTEKIGDEIRDHGIRITQVWISFKLRRRLIFKLKLILLLIFKGSGLQALQLPEHLLE